MSVVSDAVPTSDQGDWPARFLAARVVAGVFVVSVWAASLSIVVTLGACDAFGGRCDGSRPTLFDDGGFGTSFVTTSVAAWVLWWLRRPSKRSAMVGVPVAFVVAVVVAFVTRGMTPA